MYMSLMLEGWVLKGREGGTLAAVYQKCHGEEFYLLEYSAV
jgi:hypothetical protein